MDSKRYELRRRWMSNSRGYGIWDTQLNDWVASLPFYRSSEYEKAKNTLKKANRAAKKNPNK